MLEILWPSPKSSGPPPWFQMNSPWTLLEKFISIVMFMVNGITTDSQMFYNRLYYRKLTNFTDG